MTDADQNLMLEILKEIRSDVADLKQSDGEIQLGIIGIREDIYGTNGELHSLSGRILGLEKSMHSVDRRMKRIETRLNLVDA